MEAGKKQEPLGEDVDQAAGTDPGAGDGEPETVEAQGEVISPEESNGTSEPDGDEIADLEQVQRELDRHREAMLRMQAEMENLRKRTAREMEKSRKFALERIMKDLLQVHDSLERGLEVDDQTATVESMREGKALTLRMLGKVMEDHGLEVVDPAGEPFNPEHHEAMTMAPSEEHEENTVLEVLQKGFKLNDRLIRPAMVVVSKKPE